MIVTVKCAVPRCTDHTRRLSRAAFENGTRGMTIICDAKSASRTWGTDMLKPRPPASVRCTTVEVLIWSLADGSTCRTTYGGCPYGAVIGALCPGTSVHR